MEAVSRSGPAVENECRYQTTTRFVTRGEQRETGSLLKKTMRGACRWVEAKEEGASTCSRDLLQAMLQREWPRAQIIATHCRIYVRSHLPVRVAVPRECRSEGSNEGGGSSTRTTTRGAKGTTGLIYRLAGPDAVGKCNLFQVAKGTGIRPTGPPNQPQGSERQEGKKDK